MNLTDAVADLVESYQQWLRDSEPRDKTSAAVPKAFESLVTMVTPRLTGIAAKIIHDPDAAADIAQESVIKLWQVLDEYFEARRVWPWLCTTTKNGSIDEVRRRDCRLQFAADSQSDTIPAKHEDERFMDVEHAEQRLKAIRENLPNRLKDVLDLRGLDLKAKEIAGELGRPTSTVHRNIKEIEMIALGMHLETTGSNNAYERFVSGESAGQMTESVRGKLRGRLKNVLDLRLQGLKAEEIAREQRRSLSTVYHDLGKIWTIAQKVRQQNNESNNLEVSGD